MSGNQCTGALSAIPKPMRLRILFWQQYILQADCKVKLFSIPVTSQINMSLYLTFLFVTCLITRPSGIPQFFFLFKILVLGFQKVDSGIFRNFQKPINDSSLYPVPKFYSYHFDNDGTIQILEKID